MNHRIGAYIYFNNGYQKALPRTVFSRHLLAILWRTKVQCPLQREKTDSDIIRKKDEMDVLCTKCLLLAWLKLNTIGSDMGYGAPG